MGVVVCTSSPLPLPAPRACAGSMHLHVLGSCPECLLQGNAFEFSQQRGVVVHGSHLARLEGNVFNDVRGAGM